MKMRTAIGGCVLITLCWLGCLAPANAQTGDYGDVPALDQGWTESDRDTFYHLPQGSPIMPYEYFMALEQPRSEALFSDRAYLESMGMNYWTSKNTSVLNPDGLPIGLTIDRGLMTDEPKLGMNCAACHVTEITLNGQKTLVDGGVSLFDFARFTADLLASLKETAGDPAKFDRFARRLLGKEYTEQTARKLHRRVRYYAQRREQWSDNNTPDFSPGPGRVDALNIILNRTTGHMLDRPDNSIAPNAPVSFPPLWGAPYLTHVQYNGVVPNRGAGALGRNVGQVLGVFGEVSLIESTMPGGYFSSVRLDSLQTLESSLQTLRPPRWAEVAARGVLPPLDEPMVADGAKIYAANCVECHQRVDPQNYGELASLPVNLVPLKDIGTDPAAAMGFASRLVSTGPIKGRPEAFVRGDPFCKTAQANAVLAHITVGVIMHDVGEAWRPVLESFWDDLMHRTSRFFGGTFAPEEIVPSDKDLILSMRAEGAADAEIIAALTARSTNRAALYEQMVKESHLFDGLKKECMGEVQTAQYRARPLDGVWASAPYLHNGSVPTLKDLLMPVAQRPTRFYVGTPEFDPVGVGFVQDQRPHSVLLDTRVAGNSNSGHEYGTSLSETDKLALIEYLKSL